MSLRPLLLAAMAIMATGVPATAAELIVNGGFENNGFGGTTTYYNLGVGGDHPVPSDFGFAVPFSNVDLVANGVYGPTLVHGGKYNLDLVGYGSTGAIFQTLATTVGQVYLVNLDYSSNAGIDGPTATVNYNGNVITVLTGTHSWQHFSGSFTAIAASTVFAIGEIYGANNAGVLLDNVSVATVPEPASWALLVAGFGLVGGAARRRATHAAA